jgi:hypothetical protein
MNELKQENDIYNAKIDEWRMTHLGKFVLIKDGTVEGFYQSLKEAFSKGSSLYGLEPFFVKQIVPSDSVNVSFMGRKLSA